MIGLLIAAAVVATGSQTNCTDPQTQADMNICSGREYKAADAAMARQWTTVAARMKQSDADLDRTYDKRPGYFAALLEGQRAWLKFRDTHCVVAGYSARGGSMEPLMLNSCLEQVTKQRTEQLRALDKMYSN